tara:strand:- start:1058 stop:1717 length:660 start_codon:yes stop_codon:yes gene_type:complete
MKIKNICIIPGLEKNTYSKKGDLVEWGDTTLINWKISQANDSNIFDKIIISSPDNKIINMAKTENIEFLKRKSNKLIDLYKSALKKFKNCNIIFLSTTFPFFSPNNIKKSVLKFSKSNLKSGFTFLKKKEYFYLNNKPLNFDFNENLKSRREIKPLRNIVPAVIMFKPNNNILSQNNIFSKENFFYEISWLESLEINSSKDIDVFNLLISKYFQLNQKK